MNVIVFTDGSYIKNNKGEFSGYGIHFPNKELPDVSRPFKHAPLTNQRAELYAIGKALHIITKNLTFSKITVYSDSEYSIKSITEWISGWEKNDWKTANGKPVKNLDIILAINKIMKANPNKIIFKHVRSHTGHNDFFSKANDVVDKLAKDGAMKI